MHFRNLFSLLTGYDDVYFTNIFLQIKFQNILILHSYLK